ncbi:MAG: tyrosine-type recombinase/integrase [Halioglobus sp.]
MRRRSELYQFRFQDREVLHNGRAALRLRFSKTDQLGGGRLIHISANTISALADWEDRIGSSGYILRSVSKNGAVGQRLNPASVNRILQRLQTKAGISEIGQLTGHSFRVGSALDLLEAGVPLEKICFAEVGRQSQ